MKTRATAMILIFASTAAEAGAEVAPVSRAEIVYSTVFLNDSAKSWDDLPIGRPISNGC